MKKLFVWIDNLIFALTNLLFSIIPVGMILIGGGLITLTPLALYFDQNIKLSGIWYVPLVGILIVLMGFKWNDVVIENYPTSIERKNNLNKTK
jgi:hypothetical protein